MRNVILKYISTWSFMRFVRLILGVIILVQGLMAAESISVLLGGAFAGMALMNIGCNGTCPVNSTRTNTKDEPEFEEVVIKK